ncbi:LEAF RUST 10 DISEASE-RESISTANCE LOCUS RECEPTOR-LIKE PROTEIN KINASE-like 1.2 [Lolium rigidum]|uniref:LEAF RUST 10 DISEASE-RESISTANCE LOCUS RECEPTOR-LIKE PROTEIN KINASE-like 1.2 n=1 Tax=Lolium rigidum TaxID=89674 RepID=UPI001F5C35ED|nr:LEAF RUST 10 DISEASE-RESISTANCE LOCUS RECEPTOR-LIKE PROTEIN KINASE-like 1.2 [Lolium rigidum]
MPMLWLLLLPLASLPRPATSGGGNASCAQATCGNLTIGYPFSLAGAQPLYCGYPPFDLTCDTGPGRAQAYLSNTFRERLFRVADIFYTNNSMVAAFASHGGCRIPDFNVSASLALFPFSISGTNKKLVFFYGCAVPAELRLSRPCSNRTMGAYISGLWDGSDEGGTLPPGVSRNCMSVSVPVREGMEPTRLHYQRLIDDGFLLELPRPLGDCDGCRRVRGECRLDLLSFQCVCPDGKLCPSFAQSNSTTQQDRGNFRLKIIGTGLAAALLCLVVLGIACIIQNVQRKRKRSASLDGLVVDGGSPLASPKKEFTLAGSLLTHIFTYEELDEATDGFSDTRVLGSGGFGTVYKGILRDGSVVAVKRLYKNSYKSVEQFENEVDILSRLRHPNLVAFYGCTSSSQGSCCRDLLLAYEFVPNGTLADHLHCGGEAPLLAWPTRLSIAVEVAAALAYLHARQVVHRDVKTSNILLDEEFHVKLADFGLSRLFAPDATHVSTAPQGTPGYVDPAYHHRYQLTDKSDVYSFGVVLVELVSSRPAVDMARDGADVNLACMAVRMIQCCEIDRLVDPRLGYGSAASETVKTVDLVAEVAFRCLQPEQDVRPSISEVLDVLREAHQRMMEKEGCTAAMDDAMLVKKSRDDSPDSVMHQWISPATTFNHST